MSGKDRVDWNLHKLAEQAVEAGLLEAGSRGYDITQQVIHQGFDSLTPAQRQASIREAVPALNEMARRQFLRECADDAPDQVRAPLARR
jgi:hypothetical protein